MATASQEKNGGVGGTWSPRNIVFKRNARGRWCLSLSGFTDRACSPACPLPEDPPHSIPPYLHFPPPRYMPRAIPNANEGLLSDGIQRKEFKKSDSCGVCVGPEWSQGLSGLSVRISERSSKLNLRSVTMEPTFSTGDAGRVSCRTSRAL